MPSVACCLFAESVREETDGRLTLVGVYNGDLLPDEDQKRLTLAPVLVIKDIGRRADVYLSVLTASGTMLWKAEATIEAVEPEESGAQAILPLPPLSIPLKAPDSISVMVGFEPGDEHLTTAGVLKVLLSSEAASSRDGSTLP